MHDNGITPKAWYQAACENSGFVCDARQAMALEELEALWHKLREFKARRDRFFGRSLLSPEVPKGLYIWGDVGRGKTFLLDCFYHCVPFRRKRRVHFHNFMIEVHQEMKRRAGERDPLMAVADSIARSVRLLCLDEFHIDDIADAMILGRLLEALLDRGVVLVTTSNYPPDGLYPNGLQRRSFLPAIALLKRELTVLHLDSEVDFRTLPAEGEQVFMTAADPASDEHMRSLFRRLVTSDVLLDRTIQAGKTVIPVRCVAGEAVWFDFKVLCGGRHDQSDYLDIACRFPLVFISDIPQMTGENAAEARRFTWLIDVLYDNHVRLVASFGVATDTLYGKGSHDGETRRVTSRLGEMRTRRYWTLPHRGRGASGLPQWLENVEFWKGRA